MPADITGTRIMQRDAGRPARASIFVPGPIFAHVLLADEINRATPKTQSALLEAMAERQVTVAGTTHASPPPFFVLATLNPIEMEGTYPLPEAQLDRFLFKVLLDYPSQDRAGAHPRARPPAPRRRRSVPCSIRRRRRRASRSCGDWCARCWSRRTSSATSRAWSGSTAAGRRRRSRSAPLGRVRRQPARRAGAAARRQGARAARRAPARRVRRRRSRRARRAAATGWC